MARNDGPTEEPAAVLRDFVDTAADAAAESDAPGTALPRRGSPLWRVLRLGRRRGGWAILAALGPGLVAANAGNDAGGIATYSTVGASYGYNLLWLIPLMAVSLAVVQEMAARMGAATGKGLSDLIRENFSIHTTAFVMLALLISNGAIAISEFVGIAAAIEVVFPAFVRYIAVPLIALAIWLLVVRGSYRTAERVFLAMTLAFFAYPVSAVLAHPDWGQALKQTALPTLHLNSDYLKLVIGTVGTTISPYMQVYVQSATAEKGITPRDYPLERIEVYLGSVFAILIAAFIIIATAATLYPHHIVINTAADAARALEPLAGRNAGLLFAVGLFGASMLAAAILPISTAYSIAEALGVEKGLDRGFGEAPVFMGLFTGLIVLGVVVALLIPGSLLIQALVFVYVISGLLLPIVLFSILRLVNDRRLMGSMVNGPIYNTVAWITAITMTILSLVLVAITVLGWFGIHL